MVSCSTCIGNFFYSAIYKPPVDEVIPEKIVTEKYRLDTNEPYEILEAELDGTPCGISNKLLKDSAVRAKLLTCGHHFDGNFIYTRVFTTLREQQAKNDVSIIPTCPTCSYETNLQSVKAYITAEKIKAIRHFHPWIKDLKYCDALYETQQAKAKLAGQNPAEDKVKHADSQIAYPLKLTTHAQIIPANIIKHPYVMKDGLACIFKSVPFKLVAITLNIAHHILHSVFIINLIAIKIIIQVAKFLVGFAKVITFAPFLIICSPFIITAFLHNRLTNKNPIPIRKLREGIEELGNGPVDLLLKFPLKKIFEVYQAASVIFSILSKPLHTPKSIWNDGLITLSREEIVENYYNYEWKFDDQIEVLIDEFDEI